ncbi:MAG TPA: DUF2148 domain-containing protein [Methanomicrobiales archaeon]|nr:DUF2148 domain-containing protein [Methanomicrobiales archaeon]
MLHDDRPAVELVAGLMALSARTAPKGKGQDALVIRVLVGDELKGLARGMDALGTDRGIKFFLRDGRNVAESDACLLIGSQREPTAGLDCGACGFATCAEMLMEDPEKRKTLYGGPNCAVRMADLGIAIGSAVKTASIHNVDNRIMFSAGATALALGLLEGCTVAYGIPLKASGKSIYFDRKA